MGPAADHPVHRLDDGADGAPRSSKGSSCCATKSSRSSICARGSIHNLQEPSEEPLVLITHSSAGVIGVKVDSVRRIVNVSTDALLPPPPIIRGIRGELLIAIVPYEDEVYLLIDIENILSGDEKREFAEADLTPRLRDSA